MGIPYLTGRSIVDGMQASRAGLAFCAVPGRKEEIGQDASLTTDRRSFTLPVK